MGLTVSGDIDNLLKSYKALNLDSSVMNKNDSSWENVRDKRDYLLRSSDWTVTPGCTVDQAAWAAYRQLLRDLPQTYKGQDSTKVAWPKTPSTSGPNTIE